MNGRRKVPGKLSLRAKNNSGALRWMVLTVLFFPALLLMASTGEAGGKFDPKALIFEHLQDSYEWHITQWNGQQVSISLPVIVRAHDGSWHCFSSSHLMHGGEYGNFRLGEAQSAYPHKVVERLEGGEEYRPWDLSITKTTVGMMIGCLILLLLVLSLARWHRQHRNLSAPGGWLGVLDRFILDLDENLIRPCIGKLHRRYSPYLLTAFFFIFINNLLGLIPVFPGGANVTGNIAVTIVLALFTFAIVNLSGTKEYWHEVFWPEVPLWMKLPLPLMPLIEIFGVFTKPFALLIRLFANMMAGHAVLLGLTCLIFITAQMSPIVNGSMTVVAVLMSIFMNCLELLVAYIQAYVFTMLSAVFIGLAVKEHKKVSDFEFRVSD